MLGGLCLEDVLCLDIDAEIVSETVDTDFSYLDFQLEDKMKEIEEKGVKNYE